MNSFVLCNPSGSYKVRWKITLLHPLFASYPLRAGYASKDLREGIHFSSAPAGGTARRPLPPRNWGVTSVAGPAQPGQRHFPKQSGRVPLSANNC